jgi:hypothetical protein
MHYIVGVADRTVIYGYLSERKKWQARGKLQ